MKKFVIESHMKTIFSNLDAISKLSDMFYQSLKEKAVTKSSKYF